MDKTELTKVFHFKIEGYTPATLPMARLAEYMADLAALLGHEGHVHFVRVAAGSADLVHQVDPAEERHVLDRLHLVKQGIGPDDAQKAFQDLNAKLRHDGKTAKMSRGRGNLLIFPGVKTKAPMTYGPILQQGELEGRLVRLGGKDSTKPVTLLGNDCYYYCNANAEVARRLSKVYDEYIRVFGVGKWIRNENRKWSLEHFNIDNFTTLDVQPLMAVVEKVRSLPGNGWREMADPAGELSSIRYGGKVN